MKYETFQNSYIRKDMYAQIHFVSIIILEYCASILLKGLY